ncbi:MAG: HPr family phosphocarrier protein, partial [Anaerolineae bacterium]|nr:HPr family phosphocarrier protein [Phycisphaerae bacterium]
MSREIRFDFPLSHGLHARPSSHVQALSNRFASQIQLTNTRTGHAANAKSVLSMVSADVRQNDACVISISGPDEERAETELKRFIRDVLPGCDDQLPEVKKPSGEPLLPRSLRAAGLNDHYRGVAVSGGIGWGKVVLLNDRSPPEDLANGQAIDPQKELARFDEARKSLQSTIESHIASASNGKEIGVLRAHVAILNDVALAERVGTLIARENKSAPQAVRAAAEFFISTLQNSDSAYVRERVLDLQDVCTQLLDALSGRSNAIESIKLDGPSVCVADRLTPSQFLALDRTLLKGLVLHEAGTTSHTVILARSM